MAVRTSPAVMPSPAIRAARPATVGSAMSASFVAATRVGSEMLPALFAVEIDVSSRNSRFAVAVYSLPWVRVNAITTTGTMIRPWRTQILWTRMIRRSVSNGVDSPTGASGGPVSVFETAGVGRRSRRSRSRFCCSRRGRGDDWAGIGVVLCLAAGGPGAGR